MLGRHARGRRRLIKSPFSEGQREVESFITQSRMRPFSDGETGQNCKQSAWRAAGLCESQVSNVWNEPDLGQFHHMSSELWPVKLEHTVARRGGGECGLISVWIELNPG